MSRIGSLGGWCLSDVWPDVYEVCSVCGNAKLKADKKCPHCGEDAISNITTPQPPPPPRTPEQIAAELMDRHGTSHPDWLKKALIRELQSNQDEIDKLRTAIRKHRDQRGDDRCWMDDEELYKALPEGYTPPLRDSAVELKNCQRFIDCRNNPATTYVSPERMIEELRRRANRAEKLLRDANRGAERNARVNVELVKKLEQAERERDEALNQHGCCDICDFNAWKPREDDRQHEDCQYCRVVKERDEALEALGECESWMRCECGHPACKRCRASKEAREIIAKHEKK